CAARGAARQSPAPDTSGKGFHAAKAVHPAIVRQGERSVQNQPLCCGRCLPYPVLSQLTEDMDMTETLDVLGAPMTVLRDAGLFLAEQPIPPGYFVPPHRHAD